MCDVEHCSLANTNDVQCREKFTICLSDTRIATSSHGNEGNPHGMCFHYL